MRQPPQASVNHGPARPSVSCVGPPQGLSEVLTPRAAPPEHWDCPAVQCHSSWGPPTPCPAPPKRGRWGRPQGSPTLVPRRAGGSPTATATTCLGCAEEGTVARVPAPPPRWVDWTGRGGGSRWQQLRLDPPPPLARGRKIGSLRPGRRRDGGLCGPQSSEGGSASPGGDFLPLGTGLGDSLRKCQHPPPLHHTYRSRLRSPSCFRPVS